MIFISLLPYYAIWFFLFYAAITLPAEQADAGFALGLIFGAALIFLPYFIFYFLKNYNVKEENRNDYALALFFVLLPLILAIIAIKFDLIK